ncbi:inositol monophosphatase family protein [Amycolatopsis endophytica]|uniref:Myo-inositol-1(Or 4)-monophosphatase n=1 Tax=Amycolatopsis endophytica TaxID=860233 RepID=A0A853B937_9PSEU|nr:inositol monophosphatase family protein [Amycolatopsis endophytica]NYI91284.1 myo-inositol-1(or 4)-monophosphatase [Amycolatopsis endophytica]
MDHLGLLPVAREAVALGRRIVTSRAPRSVTEKAERDLVTDIDLAVEEAVRGFLARETPDIGVVGEEHGGERGELWWVLDPVDGTANFARGIPLTGISLALVAGPSAVVAAIDLPFLDAVYTAVEGYGAYSGETRIGVSGVRDLGRAMVSVGDFAVGEGAGSKNRLRLSLLAALGSRAERVRMIGSAAADLAWVADGRLDATVNLSNLPWDTMAGVLLVREAGGLVLDTDGSDHTVESANTVALSPGLRDVLLGMLR